MKSRLLAALALVFALALPASAHPLYPGLNSGQRLNSVERLTPSNKSALAIARRYIGTNPTGWRRLWCARWLNLVERKLGRPGTGSNLAKSFASYGQRVPLSQAKPGDIVVTSRKGGGHVGYLVAKQGKTVRLLSGNSGGLGPGRRVVTEGNYPVSRIIAVVRPV